MNFETKLRNAAELIKPYIDTSLITHPRWREIQAQDVLKYDWSKDSFQLNEHWYSGETLDFAIHPAFVNVPDDFTILPTSAGTVAKLLACGIGVEIINMPTDPIEE